MKKILVAAMVLLTIPALAQIKSASLTASGLTCSMCSKAIYKALQKVPTIQDIEVDIKSSSYAIRFKDGATVVLDDVKKAVEDAGFSVASMTITANLQNVAVSKDAHVMVGGSNFHFLNAPSQVLNGDTRLTIVDKNYLPAMEFKKYGKQTQHQCYQTGTAAACCAKNGVSGRMYHVILSRT